MRNAVDLNRFIRVVSKMGRAVQHTLQRMTNADMSVWEGDECWFRNWDLDERCSRSRNETFSVFHPDSIS